VKRGRLSPSHVISREAEQRFPCLCCTHRLWISLTGLARGKEHFFPNKAKGFLFKGFASPNLSTQTCCQRASAAEGVCRAGCFAHAVPTPQRREGKAPCTHPMGHLDPADHLPWGFLLPLTPARLGSPQVIAPQTRSCPSLCWRRSGGSKQQTSMEAAKLHSTFTAY